MKHTAAILFTASMLAFPACAAPAATHPAGAAHAPTHAAQAANHAPGHGSGGMMADMKATMERIHATQDPVERARLMDQHMEEMHAMMADMHGQMAQMMEQMKGHGAAAREPAAGRHDHREMKGL
jgi:hypothetical protein